MHTQPGPMLPSTQPSCPAVEVGSDGHPLAPAQVLPSPQHPPGLPPPSHFLLVQCSHSMLLELAHSMCSLNAPGACNLCVRCVVDVPDLFCASVMPRYDAKLWHLSPSRPIQESWGLPLRTLCQGWPVPPGSDMHNLHTMCTECMHNAYSNGCASHACSPHVLIY